MPDEAATLTGKNAAYLVRNGRGRVTNSFHGDRDAATHDGGRGPRGGRQRVDGGARPERPAPGQAGDRGQGHGGRGGRRLLRGRGDPAPVAGGPAVAPVRVPAAAVDHAVPPHARRR